MRRLTKYIPSPGQVVNLIYEVVRNVWEAAKTLVETVFGVAPDRDRRQIPTPSEPERPPRKKAWQTYLESALQGRGLETSLPDSLEEAVDEARQRLKQAGASLVQKSIEERIKQVNDAKESGSQKLLDRALNRLKKDIEELKNHWLAELERFKSSDVEPTPGDEIREAVEKRLREDLESAGLRWEGGLNLREEFLVWADFGDFEVAIGALEKIEEIARQYMVQEKEPAQ
jgi:Asp-tRNA(Asn)/Glu-tRNA(Gln) amidotransferase A subunit family amidase